MDSTENIVPWRKTCSPLSSYLGSLYHVEVVLYGFLLIHFIQSEKNRKEPPSPLLSYGDQPILIIFRTVNLTIKLCWGGKGWFTRKNLGRLLHGSQLLGRKEGRKE